MQGGEAWAARGGHRGGWGGGHFSSRIAVAPRPVFFPRTVRVVPRFVFAAPFVPYYPAPAYYPPAYYPDSSYYPTDSTTYTEQPVGYSPPPPPAPAPQPRAPQSGQYSMEQGLQYRYLCLDTRKFYPDTKECSSGWLTVLPGARQPR